MSTLTYLMIVLFLAGLYFYAKYTGIKYSEGFTDNNSEKRCPDILIQKGSSFYLHNSKVAKVPGVNPIEFENLEEFDDFLRFSFKFILGDQNRISVTELINNAMC